METTPPLAFTVPEAAKAARSGATALYAAIKAGKLKARKYGARTLILHEDLKLFLESLPVLGDEQLKPVRTPDRRRKRAA
jgi:hypothetical protein